MHWSNPSQIPTTPHYWRFCPSLILATKLCINTTADKASKLGWCCDQMLFQTLILVQQKCRDSAAGTVNVNCSFAKIQNSFSQSSLQIRSFGAVKETFNIVSLHTHLIASFKKIIPVHKSQVSIHNELSTCRCVLKDKRIFLNFHHNFGILVKEKKRKRKRRKN